MIDILVIVIESEVGLFLNMTIIYFYIANKTRWFAPWSVHCKQLSYIWVFMKFCTNLILISAFWLTSSISVASKPSPDFETLQNNCSPLQLVQLDRPVKLGCFYRQNYQSDMSMQSDTIVLDYLFSHISFKNKTSGESVRFSASDLAFVAQTIVDKKKPAQTQMIGMPEYASYEKQFLGGISSFGRLLLEKYAKHYEVESPELVELLEYHSKPPEIKSSLIESIQNIQKKLKKQKPDEALIRSDAELSDTVSKSIIPPHVSIGKTIESWMVVTDQVRNKALGQELKKCDIENIWLLITGRLILLRINPTEGKPFYVSDHGKLAEIIEGRLSSLIYVNEENNDQWGLRNFVPWYNRLTPEQKVVFKSDFIRLYDSAGRKPADLIYFLSCKEDERIADIRGATQINSGQRVDFVSTEELTFGSEQDVFLETLFDYHMALIAERGKQFWEQFHREFLCGQSGKTSFLKGLMHEVDYSVFMSLNYFEQHMKNALKGRPEGLIRPVTAFGSQKDGAKYSEFAMAIPAAFDDTQSQRDIGSTMRDVLQGNEGIEEDEIKELNFLPNLAAAWFIAENVRNSRTMLYNLILLDLVESGATLEYCDKNLYSWKYLLIHPLKPERDREVQVLDLFGKRYDLEKSFDGTHPMTHGDSSTQGKSKVQKPGLNSKVTLNPVQQKEAHLLIHWLQLILSCDADLSGYVVETEKSFLAETDFKDIDSLNNLGKKKVTPQNKERWELLAKIKELIEARLSSLDLTSSIQSPVIPSTSTRENTNIYPCLSAQILCYPAIDSEKPFLCTKDRNLEFRINSNGILCYCKVGLCEDERKTYNNLSYKIVNEIKTMCKLSQNANWELTPFKVAFFWGQYLEWIFLDAVSILFQDVE